MAERTNNPTPLDTGARITAMTGGPYDDWEHPGYPSAWEQTIGREKDPAPTAQGRPPKGVFFKDVVLPNILAGIVIVVFLFICGAVVAGTVMSG